MTSNPNLPIAVVDQQVVISVYPSIEWQTITGGTDTKTTIETSVGTATVYHIPGRREFAPITVTKPFVPKTDIALLEYLQSYRCSGKYVDVVQRWVEKCNGNANVLGDIATYKDCLIVNIVNPTADDIGTSAAMIEVVLQPNGIVYGAGRSKTNLRSASPDIDLNEGINDLLAGLF